MRILFSPATASNQYIENMISLLAGMPQVSVETQVRLSLRFILKNWLNRYDYIIINWLENNLVSKNKRLNFLSLLRFAGKFLIYRVMARKLIFVRHNIYPHALKGSQALLATRIIEAAIKLSTTSIVHSGHLVNDRAQYVPHPLYKINTYSEQYQDSDYFVIFGRIVEYKAIHSLLEFWGSERLIIAGIVEDVDYAAKLKAIIESRGLTNVELRASYLTEQEAEDLVAHSKGLVISHCDTDMIVSGSFFFAASLGVPVYALPTPFFSWLEDRQDYQGIYTFDSLQALANEASNTETLERSVIHASAQRLFSDDMVVSSWASVLYR